MMTVLGSNSGVLSFCFALLLRICSALLFGLAFQLALEFLLMFGVSTGLQLLLLRLAPLEMLLRCRYVSNVDR